MILHWPPIGWDRGRRLSSPAFFCKQGRPFFSQLVLSYKHLYLDLTQRTLLSYEYYKTIIVSVEMQNIFVISIQKVLWGAEHTSIAMHWWPTFYVALYEHNCAHQFLCQ